MGVVLWIILILAVLIVFDGAFVSCIAPWRRGVRALEGFADTYAKRP
jgi:hypothetical protein